jgi:hypothetical protein
MEKPQQMKINEQLPASAAQVSLKSDLMSLLLVKYVPK